VRIAALLLLLLYACASQAVPLPSSITGGYLTPERSCRLELYRWVDPNWTVLDLQCLRFADGLQTSVTAVIFTLGPGNTKQCPDGASLALPFDPRIQTGTDKAAIPGVFYLTPTGWHPLTKSMGEYFSIQSFGPDYLSVLVGLDPSGLVNGHGVRQTWIRQSSFASRAPYTCEPPPTVRFRVFGR
jgi:hypothetical protein